MSARTGLRPETNQLLVRFVLLGVLLLALVMGAWQGYPELRVYVDPHLDPRVDWEAFRRAFNRAGVARLRLLPLEGEPPLGAWPHQVAIALVQVGGRNPLLDEQARRRGLTGPGYTRGRVAQVYPDEIARLLWKRRREFGNSGRSWPEIRLFFFTNVAIHEAWHAITGSHSHNVEDPASAMFYDPGAAALHLGSDYLPFTRGHRQRLQEIFAWRRPW